jgi:hypothetical protein
MRKFFRELAIILIAFLPFATLAQVSSVSPYSRIGLGSIQTQNYTRSLGFGGANLAIGDAFYINATNPASYVNLDLTSLEVGFFSTNLTQEQASPSVEVQNSNSGLRYFSIGVPLTDWWGSAIGLQPYTTRGYDITTQRYGPDSILVEDRFVGSGSLNRFYWGNGFKLFNGLRLGVNASFIFGQLEDQNIITWGGSINNSVFEDEVNVRTLALDYGLQYSLELGRNDLGLGATYATSANLRTRSETYNYTTTPNGTPVDSIVTIGEGRNTIPGTWGVGMVFGRRAKGYLTQGWWATSRYAWSVSADIESFLGSGYETADGDTPYNNSLKTELGLRIVPALMNEEINRTGNYFSRIEYRLGGYYEETPLQIQGRTIPDYGITFGLGLPMRQNLGPGENRRSIVNAGFIFGRRGTLEDGLIRESYFKLFIGITFNDKWFIDYKYR